MIPGIRTTPILDVRSPGEYAQGHVPGAVSFPLFSDEERAAVGLRYAKSGPRDARLLGLRFVGPRLEEMARRAIALAPKGELSLYCWRGGERSASVAWLLEGVGLKVDRLEGGYRAWRRLALAELGAERECVVLSGPTGSGKTKVLRALRERGEQTVDLEALANHRGSAFGGLGLPPQPTDEQFGNELAVLLAGTDRKRRLWIEDESRNIGRVTLPQEFWAAKSRATVVRIEPDRDRRLRLLTEEYAAFPREELRACFERISRRLGAVDTARCLEALDAGNPALAADRVLAYYDKGYRRSAECNQAAKEAAVFRTGTKSPEEIADLLLAETDSHNKDG